MAATTPESTPMDVSRQDEEESVNGQKYFCSWKGGTLRLLPTCLRLEMNYMCLLLVARQSGKRDGGLVWVKLARNDSEYLSH